MKSFRCIVLATDFSPSSERAFEEALAIAGAGGGNLLIVHAYQPASLLPTDIAAVPAVYAELDASLRGNSEKHLEALAGRAREKGVTTRSVLLSGTPEEAIVDLAKQDGADLIVMGTAGRRGVAGLLLGSVASRVIATAPCPVLTVRAATPHRPRVP